MMKSNQSLLKPLSALITALALSTSASLTSIKVKAEPLKSFTEVVGSTSFKMLEIPGTTLQAKDGSSEKVSTFYMAETETTHTLFQEFVTATDFKSRNRKGCHEVKLNATKVDRSLNSGNASKGDEPVVCITWQDTQAFIAWLNAHKSASTTLAGEYRLPTEAEWTLAAKGKDQSEFPSLKDQKICEYGNIADSRTEFGKTGDYTMGDVRVFADYVDCVDGNKYISEVGQYRANHFGLKDMMGNVWEMTQQVGTTKYLAGSSEYLTSQWMVVKGGSFSAGRSRLSAEYRVPLSKTEARNEVGFRLVFAPMTSKQSSGSYQPLKI